MQKEKKPNFFSFNTIGLFIALVSFVALFSFLGKLEDIKKIIYIVVPIILLLIMANIIRYCRDVNKFYNSYIKLFENNEGLIQNYNSNKSSLEQEKYNNNVLRDFFKNTLGLLMVYNDLSKDEKINLKKDIMNKFLDNNKNGGKENE